MTTHAHITLKSGRDLEFPLMIGWEAQADQSGLSTRDFVLRESRFWFTDEEDQFSDDDVTSVRVAR